MMDMNLLAVVTPPTIYQGCSTWKTFWEENLTGEEKLFLYVKMIFLVVAMLVNTERSRVVTSMSPWTSH